MPILPGQFWAVVGGTRVGEFGNISSAEANFPRTIKGLGVVIMLEIGKFAG